MIVNVSYTPKTKEEVLTAIAKGKITLEEAHKLLDDIEAEEHTPGHVHPGLR